MLKVWTTLNDIDHPSWLSRWGASSIRPRLCGHRRVEGASLEMSKDLCTFSRLWDTSRHHLLGSPRWVVSKREVGEGRPAGDTVIEVSSANHGYQIISLYTPSKPVKWNAMRC